MSPRRNRPKPTPPLETTHIPRVEREGEWIVRSITGAGATKTYRCPGCMHEIRPGVAHVVTWREDELGDRRHWHTGCWRARDRRGPDVERSRNAPRYG